jgi:hypothetical protein
LPARYARWWALGARLSSKTVAPFETAFLLKHPHDIDVRSAA